MGPLSPILPYLVLGTPPVLTCFRRSSLGLVYALFFALPVLVST